MILIKVGEPVVEEYFAQPVDSAYKGAQWTHASKNSKQAKSKSMDSTTGFGSTWRIRNEEVKKTEIKPASVVKTEPVEPNKDFDFFFYSLLYM